MPPSEWHSATHAYHRSQLMACMRAGVIALVLLGILALIVVFSIGRRRVLLKECRTFLRCAQ